MSGKYIVDKETQEILEPYILDYKVQKMKEYIHHGSVSTYDHCMNVVVMSCQINKTLKLNINEKDMAVGALLHDFYLYDWHVKDRDHRLHGFFHPEKAATNAKRQFDINERQSNIIESHMWPLTITRIPKSKEAVIVCIADKISAVKETLFMRQLNPQNN